MNPFSVLVLAAGQGTRMKSVLPKVLHPLAGRPLVEHVLQTVSSLKPSAIGVVLGHRRRDIERVLALRGWTSLKILHQPQPRGSGHAVKMASSWLARRGGSVLVVYGDTPLLTRPTLQRLLAEHARGKAAATFLAMDVERPAGYGRMVTGFDGTLEQIVEDREASEDQKKIRLVNSGVACWSVGPLLKALSRLRADNAKGEYYLTDAVAHLRAQGHTVRVIVASDETETHGINTRVDLARAESILRRRILERWMLAGVTIVDPAATYISADAVLGAETRLWPGTVIQGASRIGPRCDIGPYTVIEDAVVGDGARVGPFARLRPGTVLESGARVGNFVEIKKSRIGRGSKVNHLSYIGDTRMGSEVNVGAGTITCNYDGFQKLRTIIGDGVFIGSNANLVAPVRIGRRSIVAAGSTVTDSVPAEALALARSRQLVKPGWARTFRKQRSKRINHD